MGISSVESQKGALFLYCVVISLNLFLQQYIFHSPLILFSSIQIMRETDTTITWPSKLKIGAKSKKGKVVCRLQ